jgi:hypothetical protein
VLLGAGTRGSHVSRALVVAAEDELGLTLDVQDGRDVGVCAEMAEHFIQAAVQRAVRASVGYLTTGQVTIR